MGTFIEYYDYALYGLSAAIIADTFLPKADPTVALIQSFGIFALGFVAKPLGSIFFGKISDTFGRRLTLKYSIIGVAVPTTLIGILPEYSSWGVSATIILMICRFTQGLFVSGEYDAAVIYLLENMPKERHGLAKSLIGMSATTGVLVASCVLAVLKSVDLPEWIWRIPFVIGGLAAFVTIYLRRNFTETIEFIAYQKANNTPKLPYRKVIMENWNFVLAAIVVCGGIGGLFNFYIMFWNTFLSRSLDMFSSNQAHIYTTITLASYVLLYPVSGIMADKFGRERTFFWSAITTGVCFAANAIAIASGTFSLLVQILTAACIPFTRVSAYILITRLFSVGQRHQCLGTSHAMGSMIFSGTAPIIGMLLWKYTGLSYAPLFYGFFLVISMSCAAIYLITRPEYKLRHAATVQIADEAQEGAIPEPERKRA